MEITQVEIDFAPYLQTAIAFPEAAEIKPLLDILEQSIESKDLSLKLSEAGTAIEKLSGVLAAKCDRTLDRWDAKWHPREPVLDLDKFPGLFVEPCIDLSGLLEPGFERYYPESRESANRCGSVAVEVDSAKLADAIEAEIPEQQALENAIALAHAEDIDVWVEVVRSTLVERMALAELIDRSGLSIVQVWIALLFGEFQLEREGDFYEGKILVTLDKTRD